MNNIIKMGNKNNRDYLSNYTISQTGNNYLNAVKKGMKILSNKMENNTNNIYKALEKKYFDKIINIRRKQTITNTNKFNNITWKSFIIQYFNTRINEEEYFSNILNDIQKESFLSENKYVSSAFFKEFELLTEPENLEKIDRNLKFNENKEIDKDEILINNLNKITNNNQKESNFNTSKINLSNITVNLGGSFNLNNETTINDETTFQYKIIRNRIKAIMKVWKTHLKNNDHPIKILISIFEKHFTNYIIYEKKKIQVNDIKIFNDNIIKEIQKFILKIQTTLKLMYIQSFDFSCFSEEKDETINIITNCLFQTGNLYDQIYSLFKIELRTKIDDYSKKLKILEKIQPQQLNIPDKFCLNTLTEEYKKTLKNNKNNDFILTGINNNDNNEKKENVLEIDTGKKSINFYDINIKKEGYKSAINLLKGLKHNKTPFEKMMLIASISTEITKCVNNYWKGMEHYINPTLLNINADELMSIFIFIVIKSQMPELIIHKKIISDFTTKNIKQSSIGYFNITLEGSVQYILNTAINELGFEDEYNQINDGIINNSGNDNKLPFSIDN